MKTFIIALTCGSALAAKGRCGPLFGNQKCVGTYSGKGGMEYCNTRNGWCGVTSAHKNAQPGNKFDYCPPGRCGPKYCNQACVGTYSKGGREYCNTRNGWCGVTSAHKNAQRGDAYDFKKPKINPKAFKCPDKFPYLRHWRNDGFHAVWCYASPSGTGAACNIKGEAAPKGFSFGHNSGFGTCRHPAKGISSDAYECPPEYSFLRHWKNDVKHSAWCYKSSTGTGAACNIVGANAPAGYSFGHNKGFKACRINPKAFKCPDKFPHLRHWRNDSKHAVWCYASTSGTGKACNIKSSNVAPAGYHFGVNSGFSWCEDRNPAQAALTSTTPHDRFGRLMGAVTTKYSPSLTLSCCEKACSGADCKQGCKSWLRQSSLNWEAESWWPKLEDKCELDCAMPGMWRKNHLSKSTLDHSESLWEQSKKEPVSVDACKQGCKKYQRCMQSLKSTVTNKAEAPLVKEQIRS